MKSFRTCVRLRNNHPCVEKPPYPILAGQKSMPMLGQPVVLYDYDPGRSGELPKAGTVEAIEALLPGNLKRDQIKIG